MTDNPPVAAAQPLATLLPQFLLNSSLADVEVGTVLDAAGVAVEPVTFERSQIKGFPMRRLPMPQLHVRCIWMDLLVPDNATQSSLIEALATKKLEVITLNNAATQPAVLTLDPGASEDEDAPVGWCS